MTPEREREPEEPERSGERERERVLPFAEVDLIRKARRLIASEIADGHWT